MLTINNVKKNYGRRLVLDQLNFHIEAGEIYGLLGPNGAGKTTTINLICNLLKPSSGEITFNYLPISRVTKELIGVASGGNFKRWNAAPDEYCRGYCSSAKIINSR